MELLNLETLAEFLNFKDPRSVRRWCDKNNVFIIKQGKQECVSQISFEEAFNKPLIVNLKNQYGGDWEEVYKMHQSGDVVGLANLKKDPTSIRRKWKPSSPVEAYYAKIFSSDHKGPTPQTPSEKNGTYKSLPYEERQKEVFDHYNKLLVQIGCKPFKGTWKKPGGWPG
jgi:hypothetical protein